MTSEELSGTINGNKTGDRQIPTNFGNWDEGIFDKLETRENRTENYSSAFRIVYIGNGFGEPKEANITRSQ